MLLLNKNNSLFIALAINKASQLLPNLSKKASLKCKTKLKSHGYFKLMQMTKMKIKCLEDSAKPWPSIVKCLTSKHKQKQQKILSRGYSMYATVRRGAVHRGRSPCTPLEDSGQNADGPSSPHLDTLPLSPRWLARGAEFMGGQTD